MFTSLANGRRYFPAHMVKLYGFCTHFSMAFTAQQQQPKYRPKEAFCVNEWVRPLAVLLGLCLLSVLPAISDQQHPLIYSLSLLFPLLGLLLFNSKRHREMRQKLVEVRHLREAISARQKAR